MNATTSNPYIKLLLIRHAESVGNVQKRMEGQSSTALTARGIEQAKQLAKQLVQSRADLSVVDLTKRLTHLYSSPLLRARQTAQCLSAELQQMGNSFQTIVDPQLQEIHQGIFQGLTWTEAEEKFPDLCQKLMSASDWMPVPEAESPAEVRARSQNWLAHILAVHQPGDILWIVSHAGFLMHLIAEIIDCGGKASSNKERIEKDRIKQMSIAHTAVFEFQLPLWPLSQAVVSNSQHGQQNGLTQFQVSSTY